MNAIAIVKIKYPKPIGYAFIPKADFNPEIHELFEEEKSATVAEKNSSKQQKTKAEESTSEAQE